MSANPPPTFSRLYFASLGASLFVYVFGAIGVAVLVYFTDPMDGWGAARYVFYGFAKMAVMVLFLVILIIAPLASGIAYLLFRKTTRGFWQGPLTGALTAFLLGFFPVLITAGLLDAGGWLMVAIYFSLSIIAGGLVQQTILKRPYPVPEKEISPSA